MQREVDFLVIGAGAAGLAAAVTAARAGLRVMVAEKTAHFGGTTAASGGWVWVPCSTQARAAGIRDSLDEVRRYLRAELGSGYDPALVDAYLQAAPGVLDYFEQNSALVFDLGPHYSDYHPETPGGLPGGRALVARPCDGRGLGREIARLRPPVPETTFLGMMVGSGKDLKHFFNVTRSVVSAGYVALLLARYLRDRLVHGRGMRLTNGNALVARLAMTAFEAGVDLVTGASLSALTVRDGRVTGARLETGAGPVEVSARCGVLLAAGGFAHDPAMQAQLYPHVRAGSPHHSAVSPANTGAAQQAAARIGADMVTDLPNAAAWVPLSLVPRKGGGAGPFPHFIDRAKPGVIAVTRDGRRFANEADSYHDFIQALQRATPPRQAAECWLIAGHAGLRKYGLGHVKPFPVPIGGALRSGYLRRGKTLTDLAGACGIDAAALAQTVAGYDAAAAQGADPAFARGSTAYNRFLGDPTQQPNPCVGPVGAGPYYAVRLVAGDLGTFAGLRIDACARVLTPAGQPLPGLYAAGNDALSLMAGSYPGAGITLGPALVFGHLAARHAAENT